MSSTDRTIKVFGSALVRVVPDIATLTVEVERFEDSAEEAFSNVKQDMTYVQEFLAKYPAVQSQASKVRLQNGHEYRGERRDGYRATIGINIVVSDIELAEEIMTGAVSAGANRLNEVDFESTNLKDHREEARRMAIDAAFRKAEVYATAAGVKVGPVISIEDQRPDRFGGSEGHMRSMPIVDDNGGAAIDPGSILVNGSVIVVFEIA